MRAPSPYPYKSRLLTSSLGLIAAGVAAFEVFFHLAVVPTALQTRIILATYVVLASLLLFVWLPLVFRWLRPLDEFFRLGPQARADPAVRARTLEAVFAFPARAAVSYFVLWMLGGSVGMLLEVWKGGMDWSRLMVMADTSVTIRAAVTFYQLLLHRGILDRVLDENFPEATFLVRFRKTWIERLFTAASVIGFFGVCLFFFYVLFFLQFTPEQFARLSFYPIPAMICFVLVVGGTIASAHGPISRFLEAAADGPIVPAPLAVRAHDAAIVFPYRNAVVIVVTWIATSFAIVLNPASARGLALGDTAGILAGMLLASLGVSLYQMNWHREILKPFLRLVGASLVAFPEGMTLRRTTIRGKLLVNFLGLVLFALTLAYLLSFIQFSYALRSVLGAEARPRLDRMAQGALAGEMGQGDLDMGEVAHRVRTTFGRSGYSLVADRLARAASTGEIDIPAEKIPEAVFRGTDGRVEAPGLQATLFYMAAGPRWIAVLACPWSEYLAALPTPLGPVVSFVVLLVLSGGFVFYSSRDISGPIADLTAAADEIGRGDLDRQVPSGESDEVGRLAAAFERMRLALKSKIEDLELASGELKAAHHKLVHQETLAAIGKVASAISHEIRNPLSSIKMNLQILGKRLSIGEREARHFRIAMDEIDRLNAIVTELLDFAKPVELAYDLKDLNELLEEALGLVEGQLAARGIIIERGYGRGLPPLALDAGKLKQVWINLYLNAAEAMANGGVLRVATETRSGAGGAEVVAAVSDSGPGIPPEVQGRIFEPFFTTKPEGTGLGLAGARKIVEEHGGRIEVVSPPGAGTTFRIAFPYREGARPPARAR